MLESSLRETDGPADPQQYQPRQGPSFTDADLAYPLEEIAKIVRTLGAGEDIGIADRTWPQSLYHMSPEFFSCLNPRHLFEPSVQPAGQRAAADLNFARLRLDGFAFDVEVLYIAKQLGSRFGRFLSSPGIVRSQARRTLSVNSLRVLRDLAE